MRAQHFDKVLEVFAVSMAKGLLYVLVLMRLVVYVCSISSGEV